MKKFAKIAVLCLSAVALMGMSGCNYDNKDPDDPIVEKEVKVIGLELAESITVDCGATQKLEAKVLPENATNKAVTWSITQDPETDPAKKATVDLTGKVHIPAGHIASTNNQENTLIKVTATSVYDNTKTGTAKITVL